MRTIKNVITAFLLTTSLLLITSSESVARSKVKKRAAGPPTRAELKEAERRLSEMGYWTGPVDGVIDSTTHTALIAFQ